MNSEILTITLPEEKPPLVDVKQRFEVGGIVLQARLTLINNVLPVSAVQQEESTDQRMERIERSLAALAKRKPDKKPEPQSPFLRRKEAQQLLRTRSTLEACERAGWLKKIKKGRIVFYLRTEVMQCVWKISQGDYP